MEGTDYDIEFATRLQDSLKKDLKDIAEEYGGFHLNAEYLGRAILWSIGSFNGKVNIISNKESEEIILLELPPDVQYDSNASVYISSLKTVSRIYDKIEGYLMRNGKLQSEHFGRRCFHMKKIPG